MKLSIGIVGLPNVGKSTLFNAITHAGAESANYPFCTIEPNVGIVPVPDFRLKVLSDISGSHTLIPATITFVDIAGLVKGASKGEGLGNQFLSNIRETSAIAHVVRCFDDDDIIHVHGKVNPIEDIEVINAELLLADLDLVEKLISTYQKKAKSGKREDKQLVEVFEAMAKHLSEGHPLRTFEFSEFQETALKGFHFLTTKKMIYVANVKEDNLGQANAYVDQVKAFAESQGDQVVTICAQIEQELSALPVEERQDYLQELGLEKSGLDQLAQAGFSLLGLQTYLTTGQKETRAWTITTETAAPQAAGVIHTDFEKGFIRANIVSFSEFVSCNGWKGAKEKGVVRQEGKDYIMKDGDVVEFLFNV